MGGGGDPFKAAEQLLFDAGIIEPSPEDKVKIKMTPVMSQMAEQVGLVLGKQPKLFLRGDVVMKIEFDPNQGDLDFVPMKDSEFVTWVEKFISFGREIAIKDDEGEDTGKKRWVQSSLQQKYAKLILDSPQFRAALPRVVRKNRVRLPYLRKSGKIELLPVGFDEESGVFTFPNDVVIDESWTAKKACDYWRSLFSEFPIPVVTIGENGSKKMMQCPRTLAACILPQVALFAEGILPPFSLRCGFISTANSTRSGKSLICKMAIAAITGFAAGLPLSRDDETLKGQIDAVLLSGQSVVFFDNVKGFIESQTIESLMTLPFWQGRTFHTQRFFTVKNETTVFISGNNASVSPDINGRFVWVELKLETADPQGRKFDRELDDRWLMQSQNRGDMLSALWALTRHWDATGRPPAPTSIAGFRAWSDVVGGIVCTATELTEGAIGNPLVMPELELAGDKEGRNMLKLIDLMASSDAEKTSFEFTPAEIVELAMTHGLFEWFLPELPEGKDVGDVLKQPERVRFGKLLTNRSLEHPRGVKYVRKRDDALQCWRFSHRGGGRHKRYLLDLE